MPPKKVRTEPVELKILGLLNARMEFSTDEMQHYLNKKKGYEGEVKFDTLIACLENKFYILNDLLLESGNTKFQIDTLIITQEAIFPCEVKNFQGDYYYQDRNFFYCNSKKDINNPLHQLKRIKTLLRQLLQKHGFHIPIEEHLVFINSEFFLYQAPLNERITYHPQLSSLLKNFNTKPANLNNSHLKIAELLINAHITESPYTRLPPYTYNQVRNGFYCASCQSFSITVGEKKLVCDDCGYQEAISTAVVRMVEEFKLLFPNMRITINSVFKWCNVDSLKRKIRRILSKNYRVKGTGRFSYYVDK